MSGKYITHMHIVTMTAAAVLAYIAVLQSAGIAVKYINSAGSCIVWRLNLGLWNSKTSGDQSLVSQTGF